MGFEYFFSALQRIFKMYGKVGKYANKHTSRKDFYLAMINSSMGKKLSKKKTYIINFLTVFICSLLDEFSDWTFGIQGYEAHVR